MQSTLPTTHTRTPITRQYGYLHGSLRHVRVLLLFRAAAPRRRFVAGHLFLVALTVSFRALNELVLVVIVHVLPEVGALLGEGGKFYFLALLAVHCSPFLHEEGVSTHSAFGLVRVLVLLGRHYRLEVVGKFVSREREALHLLREGEDGAEFEF